MRVVSESPMSKKSLLVLLALPAFVSACTPSAAAPLIDATHPTKDAPSATTVPLNLLARAEFNRLAVELGTPIFWDSDANANGAIDPSELAVLWLGVDPTDRTQWVEGGAFTKRFFDDYQRVRQLRAHDAGPLAPTPQDATRAALLRRELDQGRPSLIRTSLVSATPAERALVQHVLAASRHIERIFHQQVGSEPLRARLPAVEGPERMVFYRNQGPWCVAPETEGNPACNALPGQPKKVSGLYPEVLQANGAFCDGLKAEPNAAELRSPFTVVRGLPGKLTAVPYHLAYAEPMAAISGELRAASAGLGADEAALKSYLEAAAKAFTDDSWEQADEAWAKMSVSNSKWYLRIAPDEVYFEPCSLKAGFHTSFARINQDSLRWQSLLEPLKADMERALAAAAGAPYAARAVSFHLPDFIDLVLNAGDSRDPHGGTVGQSLPNWGPVANEGRGRTVAMTNLGTDADSRADLEKLARSVLCTATMSAFTSDPEPQLMGTVLHEATHNLGPAHEYRVGNKTDREIFGGPLASMLEELKAQTGALYFTDWLAARHAIGPKLVQEAHVRSITWAFGHISRGMAAADGQARPYSQLAAIQVGWLLKDGALAWRATEPAANGEDQGCMEIRTDAFPKAIDALMRQAAGIKSRGDVDGAKKLIAEFVNVTGDALSLRETLQKRWLRAPKASYVYAIDG